MEKKTMPQNQQKNFGIKRPVIGLAVTPETLKLIDARAQALGISRAAVLRHAVLTEVDQHG